MMRDGSAGMGASGVIGGGYSLGVDEEAWPSTSIDPPREYAP
jgi:hypothetical protein